MSSKDFLLKECENLKVVLEETLRYKYGLDGSKGFFDECEVRREFIEKEIRVVDDADYKSLEINGGLLNELSGLVSRIERSSLGEYSWPFVEELKKITYAICREDTLQNKNTPPLVFVLSDGGLDTYRIYPERKRPSPGKKRILTIVFPRTLKHYVLLHPILGHEVGHAIWRSSKHQHELGVIVKDELMNSGSRITDFAATANWLFQQNPPAAIRDILDQLIKSGFTEQTFFGAWANFNAWIEEILCDLVGLLIFGPSFTAAHCELLYALAPSGATFGPAHPPVGCRVNMIIQASKLLGFDRSNDMPEGDGKDSVIEFWESLEEKRQTDPWYNMFTDNQLRNTLTRIGRLLGQHPPTLYSDPSNGNLALLLEQLKCKVPPIGFVMDDNGGECRNIDFRHILYAGWVAKFQTKDMPFLIINRLCEHAIMQQRGIDEFMGSN